MKNLYNLTSKSAIKSTLLLILIFLSHSNFAQKRPNIIFILTDDQGYGDLACHGNPYIKTPELDKLHVESTTFTNFHVGTSCAPSRASLLTGKYANRVGAWHTINGRQIPYQSEKMLPEILKSAGYKNGIFGKWHLGDNFPHRPQDRGFDEVVIHQGGGIGQQPDFWGNDYFDDTYFKNGNPQQFKGYCTDVWFSEAIKFIENNKKQPFFCYLALNAPHSPYIVPKKYSEKYAGNPKVPSPEFYGMIENIDENLGKLRQKLKEFDIEDNTILVFMTDNGTAAGVKFDNQNNVVSGFNADMRGIKTSPYEGGHRVPFFIHWKAGKLNTFKTINGLTSCIDFMPTLLDLCQIKPPKNIDFDGISLKSHIQRPEIDLPKRILFVDNQREENLVKWKQVAIMQENWRMIGKTELYNLTNDPSQKQNIINQHPELSEKFIQEYEKWWQKVSKNAENYTYFPVGTAKQTYTILYSHDLHTEKLPPAWSQAEVIEGNGSLGFWTVEFTKNATYEFELRRFPKESGLKNSDDVSENTNWQPSKATLWIDNEVFTIENQQGVFRIKLPLSAKKAKIKTIFFDKKGIEKPVYYLYIKTL